MTQSTTLPLIGLIGRRKSGKDTSAAILGRILGYKRVAFADPLKREMFEAFGRAALRSAHNHAVVPLTDGGEALVDREDLPELLAYTWHRTERGYAARITSREGKRARVFMHRQILDAPPGEDVDHWNGNKLDNRRHNLRCCTHRQNCQNSRKRAGASTDFKGVHWAATARKYVARITVDGETRYLGGFDEALDAARAYNEAARAYFGPFAALNDTGLAGEDREFQEWLRWFDAHKNDPATAPLGWIGPMAQFYGTEYRRKMCGDSYWLDKAEPLLVPGVVVTDTRFPNEADLVRDRGGFILKLVRPQAQEDGAARGTEHDSERFVDRIVPDVVIFNDKDLGHLERELETAVATFRAMAFMQEAPHAAACS